MNQVKFERCLKPSDAVDKIDLCGVVLSKRLKSFTDKECRYTFEKCYYVVDSQIVHAMIQKSSYGFNTFAATRIGEIQGGTNIEIGIGARVNLILQIGWLEERSQVKLVFTAIGKKDLSFSNNLRVSGLFLVIILK